MDHRYQNHLKKRNIQALHFLQTSTYPPFYLVFVGFVNISEYFSRHPSFHLRHFYFFLSAKTRDSVENIFRLKHPHVCWLLKIFSGFSKYIPSLTSPSLLDFENICRPLKIYSPLQHPGVCWLFRSQRQWLLVPVFMFILPPQKKTHTPNNQNFVDDHLSFIQ